MYKRFCPWSKYLNYFRCKEGHVVSDGGNEAGFCLEIIAVFIHDITSAPYQQQNHIFFGKCLIG